MFFVIDKSKIVSYVIAICTVVILFVAATSLNDIDQNNILSTFANGIEANVITNKNTNVKVNINEINTNAANNTINNI